jgi:hypothetical protein
MKVTKKILASTLIASCGMYFAFATIIEPYFLNAQSAADEAVVSLTVDTGISITSPADTTMTPNLGVAQNSSVGTTTWVVTTNALNGYNLQIKASSSPAMKHTASSTISFANYTEAVAGTPETWSVDGGTYQFGYSAFGGDVLTAFGTGTNCGASGVPTATLNYRHASTSNITTANRTGVTTTSGATTTVCYAAGQNGVFAPSGTYNATITATAIINP